MQTLITLNEVAEDLSNIQINHYISFAQKKTIISRVLEACTIEQDSIKRIDYSLLQMLKVFTLVNNYTNIDLSSEDDIIDAFDQLELKSISKHVLSQIPSTEIDFFNRVIEAEIQQMHQIDNSLQTVVAKALTQLINKLPSDKAMAKLLKDIPKQIGKISPETVELMKTLSKQK